MRALVFITLSIFNVYAFALTPKREYKVKPSDFGLTYNEIKINTSDGLKLNAWFFPANQTSYKVMVLSDDGNGNMSDLLEHVSIFLSLGYNVLTYDYRGYGSSSDFEIKENFYFYLQFQNDLNSVIDYLKKEHSNLPKIHLYGIGIGAGLSIAVAANRNIGIVIADSPYITLELAKQRIKEARGIEMMIPLGYNKNQIEPKYALETKGGQMNGILLICGDKDKVYQVKDMKELAKIRPKITSLYVAKNSDGNNNLAVNKEKYFEEIKKFLKL